MRPFGLAAAVAMGTVFVKRQLALPAPMLPVDLFRRPLFALSAFTSTASFTTQGLAFVGLTLYSTHVRTAPKRKPA